MKLWIYCWGAVSVWASVTCYAPVLKCMSCHKAESMMHCVDTVLCNPTLEVCYVEEEIDVGGETVVNAGCRLREHCDGIGCYGEEAYRRKRDLQHNFYTHHVHEIPDFVTRDVACHHCCDGDFCNMYGCPNTYGVNQLPGSRCMVCEAVEDPVLCSNVQNCKAGESCVVKQVMDGGVKKYQMGCIKARMCAILAMLRAQNGGGRRKRFVPVWSDCCDAHLCNRNIPMKSAAPSMFSETYICPTLGINNTWLTSPSTTTASTPPPTTPSPPTTQTYAPSKTSKPPTPPFKPSSSSPPPPPAVVTPTKGSIIHILPGVDQTNCVDLVNCKLHERSTICEGRFKPWAEVNCPSYCGFCQDVVLLAEPQYDAPTNAARDRPIVCLRIILAAIFVTMAICAHVQ